MTFNNFSVGSKPVTKTIISIEMDESVASLVANAIARNITNYGREYEVKDLEIMNQLCNTIKGHLP